MVEHVTAEDVSVELKQLMAARAADPRLVWGIPWGFNGLDKLTGGIHRGEMSILAARPAVGKSFLVGQIAVQVATYLTSPDGRMRHKTKNRVKLVLCEMSAASFQMRLVCQEAQVSPRRVMTGRMTAEQQRRFTDAADKIAGLPIDYLDSPLSFDETRKWLMDGGNCAWWCVDYVGIHPGGPGNDDSQPYKKVSYLSAGFRDIARRYAPGLLVAQLSRKAEGREDKRPQLPDLRDSGNLEQDASGVVMALFRPDLYVKVPDEDALRAKEAELIVLKQRNGPIGTIEMLWVPTKPGYVDNSELIDDLEDGK